MASQNHDVETFNIQISVVDVFDQIFPPHFKGNSQGNNEIDLLRQDFTAHMSFFTFFCKNLTEKPKFSNRIVSITVLMLNDAVLIVIICVDLAVPDLQ